MFLEFSLQMYLEIKSDSEAVTLIPSPHLTSDTLCFNALPSSSSRVPRVHTTEG